MDERNLTDEQAKAERESIVNEVFEGREPEVKADGQQSEAGVIVENEDPWAGVNPALKKEFEDLRTRAGGVDTMAERLRQAESRIGSITNQLHNEKKAAESVSISQTAAPTKEQIAAAAQSDEEWDALKEEFPTWGSAVDKKFASEKAATLKEIDSLKADINTLKQSGAPSGEIEGRVQAVKIEIAKEMVSLQHPGWEQTVKTPEFSAWINSQPAEIKQKCESWNIADAVFVLNAFGEGKKSKTAAEIAADRKERLTKSTTQSSPGRVRQSSKLPDDMTDAEYRAHIANEMWAK